MSRLKVNTSYSEYNNSLYYRFFDIVDELPEHESVKEVKADIQNNDEVLEYDLFECVIDDCIEFYAIRKDRKKDITVKGYPANITIFVSDYNYITEEPETKSFMFDTDGLYFEDDDEMNDYIQERILFEIQEWFDLSEDDQKKIKFECRILLDKYVE